MGHLQSKHVGIQQICLSECRANTKIVGIGGRENVQCASLKYCNGRKLKENRGKMLRGGGGTKREIKKGVGNLKNVSRNFSQWGRYPFLWNKCWQFSFLSLFLSFFFFFFLPSFLPLQLALHCNVMCAGLVYHQEKRAWPGSNIKYRHGGR